MACGVDEESRVAGWPARGCAYGLHIVDNYLCGGLWQLIDQLPIMPTYNDDDGNGNDDNDDENHDDDDSDDDGDDDSDDNQARWGRGEN